MSNWQQTSAPNGEWYSVACSSDASKQVALIVNTNKIYTSNDYGLSWIDQSVTTQNWYSVSSSSDGTKLVAVVAFGGYIFTSTDSGVTWNQSNSLALDWRCVASSSDGTKIVAGISNGYIYTSTDSGVNWTARATSFGNQYWYSVSSSSDGTNLAAVTNGEYIYTSTDSGVTWTQQINSGIKDWTDIASNSDGTKLVAVASPNYIYTSTDSGVNWTQRATSQNWKSVTSSSNGTKLAACVNGGYIYTSNDSGVTWNQESTPSLNWFGITCSSNGNKIIAIVNSTTSVGGIYINYNYPCFKEDTKILTDKGYIPIQDLRKGDLVKTLKHGYKTIDIIGKSEIYHPASSERIKKQLYQCSADHYPEIFEPLIITGCHSILVDWLTQEQGEKTLKDFGGRVFETDGKPRLCAYLDDRATVYETSGKYTIYHLALENENHKGNYGIYANGLLVESCSKRYLLEYSEMELVE